MLKTCDRDISSIGTEKLINLINKVFSVKILKYNNNDTSVVIKGIFFKIPFKLDQDKQFYFLYDGNAIKISDNKEELNSLLKTMKLKSEDNKKEYDNNKEIKSNIDMPIPEIIKFLDFVGIKSSDQNQKRSHFIRDEVGNYLFYFSLDIYNLPSELIIKIKENSPIQLIIYSSISKRLKEQFSKDSIEIFEKVINNPISIKFIDTIDDFVNKYYLLSQLDKFKKLDMQI